jgi:hypothetical protein
MCRESRDRGGNARLIELFDLDVERLCAVNNAFHTGNFAFFLCIFDAFEIEIFRLVGKLQSQRKFAVCVKGSAALNRFFVRARVGGAGVRHS